MFAFKHLLSKWTQCVHLVNIHLKPNSKWLQSHKRIEEIDVDFWMRNFYNVSKINAIILNILVIRRAALFNDDKKANNPITDLERPWGFQEVEAPKFQGGKVVSPRNRAPLPPRNIPGAHFCQRLSQPQSYSAVGRIMSMKNFNYTILNRTRDLPACSALPQPTAPRRTPVMTIHTYKWFTRLLYLLSRWCWLRKSWNM